MKVLSLDSFNHKTEFQSFVNYFSQQYPFEKTAYFDSSSIHVRKPNSFFYGDKKPIWHSKTIQSASKSIVDNCTFYDSFSFCFDTEDKFLSVICYLRLEQKDGLFYFGNFSGKPLFDGLEFDKTELEFFEFMNAFINKISHTKHPVYLFKPVYQFDLDTNSFTLNEYTFIFQPNILESHFIKFESKKDDMNMLYTKFSGMVSNFLGTPVNINKNNQHELFNQLNQLLDMVMI